MSVAAFLDLFLVALFWFLAMMVATFIWTASYMLANHGRPPTGQPGPGALLLISMPTLYIAILILHFWRGRRLVLSATPQTPLRKTVLAITVGFVLFLFTMSSTYLLNAAGLELKPTNQAVLEDMANQWPLLIGFFAVFVAPIFEEIFFRKQIFARFASAGHVAIAYVCSSLLFALMHEPVPTQGAARWLVMLTIYGSMGAVFAWVYKKTGALWPAILAHASNNAFAMLAIWLGASMS